MAQSFDPTAKTSADVEREVNEQRSRVEARIGEIRDRLSPGQLLDEALSYTKDGGSQFVGNLGSQISANPMPVALVSARGALQRICTEDGRLFVTTVE